VHLYEKVVTKPDFSQAEDDVRQGNFSAAAVQYDQIISRYPQVGDRALFQLGMIYLLPQNRQKDYSKALEYFQRLAADYPQSRYRRTGDAFIALIADIAGVDKRVSSQRKQIEKLEQQLEQLKEVDINLNQRKKTFPYSIRPGQKPK
jgi:outer membrane protein assembly factor BamD (BamD/ComL family)